MAGSMTDVFEKKVLDFIFRNTSMGLDGTNVWVGLFTAAPSDSAAGTEVSGGSYARVAVARTGAGWNAATGTLALTDNTNAVTFPVATANWGTITHFGIFDASTAGNLMYWANVDTSKVVNTNDTASFAAGAIDITQD